MGWWCEGENVLGDGPVDHFVAALRVVTTEHPLPIEELMAAVHAALDRNPADYVVDPPHPASRLCARSHDGRLLIENKVIIDYRVDAFQEALEAIALEYRESEMRRPPSTSELMANLAFVVRTRIPRDVSAMASFHLHDFVFADPALGEWRHDGLILVDVDWQALTKIVDRFGLVRDPDNEPQPPRPFFASWTRHPALDLEVDWHAPEGEIPWIEVRGEEAAPFVEAITGAGAGRMAPDPQAALAELLTVPPTIHSPANGQVRWEIITTVLTAVPAADRATALPLIAAGLADTDWRVRMAALWGVGALELESLAAAAAGTPLPPAEEPGLNGDDRRTLLALRDAAVLKASGREPEAATHEGSGPGGDRRLAFVQGVAALLGSFPVSPDDRRAALIAALLRQPGLDERMIPRAWRSWIGRG